MNWMQSRPKKASNLLLSFQTLHIITVLLPFNMTSNILLSLMFTTPRALTDSAGKLVCRSSTCPNNTRPLPSPLSIEFCTVLSSSIKFPCFSSWKTLSLIITFTAIHSSSSLQSQLSCQLLIAQVCADSANIPARMLSMQIIVAGQCRRSQMLEIWASKSVRLSCAKNACDTRLMRETW